MSNNFRRSSVGCVQKLPLALALTLGIIWQLSIPCMCQAQQLTNQLDSLNASSVAAATSTTRTPLQNLQAWTSRAEQVFSPINSYTCVLAKQEEIDGKLGELQLFEAKIRHNPFSVYLKSVQPADTKDQEVLYVDGQANNKLRVHMPPSSLKYRILGTLELDPDGIVMKTNRHPVTHTGISYLISQAQFRTTKGLVAPDDMQVREIDNAVIGGRKCSVFEMRYMRERPQYICWASRIYFDQELQLPIRYEAFSKPEKGETKPRLLEMVTYLKVDLEKKLSDMDFSTKNPSYAFP